VIDPRVRTLTYAGAGDDALLIRSDGHCESLPSSGLILGIYPAAAYESTPELTLSPGDTLLLTSDGLIESQSPAGELFGRDRVIETVRSLGEATAEDIVERLHTEAARFTQLPAPRDDVTIVAARARYP